MRWINIKAVFGKQIKETWKNKEVLIQFLMFPLLAVIMENLIHIEGMPESYFANMFSAMYVGMAPLIATVSILAEEKEKGTLRVLLMADVKPVEYLTGIGGYVWTACMLGSCILALAGGYKGGKAFFFLGMMGIGILISMVLGAAIGAMSRNQMSATAVSVPAMLVLAFLPMLASFNQTIEKAAHFVYTQQVSLMVGSGLEKEICLENIGILLANAFLVFLFFLYAYKKAELD